MKYFGISIMFILVFASCVFSNAAKENVEELSKTTKNRQEVLGDSITVDTVMGDFRIYYKVSEIMDTTLATFSCDEESSVTELRKTDKKIFLNIQKLDTTNIVSYKTIDIESFQSVVPNTKETNYYIDMFYLKEVKETSLVFVSKLCMFGTNICKDVDIHISNTGHIDYKLIE